jgi:hypothetical protein
MQSIGRRRMTAIMGTGVLSMEVGIFDNDLWWWRLLPVV